MAKSRSAITDYLVYLVLRCVTCFIQAMPFRTAYRVGEIVGTLIYKLVGKRRAIADENLQHAFPNKYSENERNNIIRGIFRHFACMLVEVFYMHRHMNAFNYKRYWQLENGEALVHCLLSDRPLLVVTCHYGNWETAGYTMAMFGYPGHAIARPLDNPYIDDFLRQFRERSGQKILAKKGDFDEIESLLERGEVLATMADQDAGKRGLFVDFFGRPASTHKAPALLAMEHKVPMVIIGTPKINGLNRIIIHDVIYPEDYEDDPNALKSITQRYTTGFEELIRLAPEQYFWIHRRWKSQPKQRQVKKKAA